MDTVVGKARVREDAVGLWIEMNIFDQAAKDFIMGEELTHLSIDTAHFVRDKNKERRLPWQQK